MTAPASKLPRCEHGYDGKLHVFNTVATVHSKHCGCRVSAPTEAAAIAAWHALCRPAHAVAEVERLRVALEKLRERVVGVFEMRMDRYYDGEPMVVCAACENDPIEGGDDAHPNHHAECELPEFIGIIDAALTKDTP